MIGHDHFEFLESRLFDKSAEMLDDSKRRDSLHGVLNDLLKKFDFENNGWPGRDRVLFTAYEYLSCAGVDGEQIALVLALLDGGISVIDTVEKNRADCLATLEGERADVEMGDSLYEPEDLDKIDREISDVRDALFFQLFRKLELEERHETAPFEGAYVRMKKMKGGKNWDVRRRKFSRIFGITERAVGAAKAWESPSLSEKGGGTVDELIEGLREKVLGTVEISPEPFSPDVLKRLYELFSDGGDLEFLKGLEPAEFYLVDGEVSLELRQWIYAVMMLVSPEAAPDARKLIAEGLSCGVGKIASCTAYLTGKLRENASGERLAQIENVEKYMAGKTKVEVDEPGESDPDYANEAKERGWREPERRMIETAWGKEVPLRGKRMLIMETPRLLEWSMLKEMGGEEQNLTIVERDERKAEEMKKLLPTANVVHATLDHWLGKKGVDRCKGREDLLADSGIPTDGTAKHTNFFWPDRVRNVSIPSEGLRWLQGEPFYPYFSKELVAFLNDPYFQVPISVGFESVDEEAYDFVSLDGTETFSSLRQYLQAVMMMGLVKKDAVICTNFVGQRDGAYDKALLDASLRAEHYFDQYGRNYWAEMFDKPLKDKREVVSLDLAEIATNGRDQYCSASFGNADSPLFKLFESTGFQIDGRFLRIVVDKFLREFEAQKNDMSILHESSARLKKLITFSALPASMALSFRSRGRKLFVPMGKRLSPKNLAKLGRRSVGDLLAPPGVKRDLEGVGFFADVLCSIVYSHMTGQTNVQNHEACGYRGGRVNMMSDFMHVRQMTSLLGVPEAVLDRLTEAVMQNRPPMGVKPRDLIDPIKSYMDLSAKYELSRVDVSRKWV